MQYAVIHDAKLLNTLSSPQSVCFQISQKFPIDINFVEFYIISIQQAGFVNENAIVFHKNNRIGTEEDKHSTGMETEMICYRYFCRKKNHNNRNKMNLRNTFLLSCAAAALMAAASCSSREDYGWLKNGIDVSAAQLKLAAEKADGTGMLPCCNYAGQNLEFISRQLNKEISAFKDSLRACPAADKIGTMRLCGIYDWRSGFFPGSLWYVYEITGDEAIREEAEKYTNMLDPVRHYDGTHDLGFMMNCSYGNALRLTQNDTIPAVLIETADNLCSRFNWTIGAIRSWDFGLWNYPVIIDNMMNLELLFNAERLTGDRKYRDIAVRHANTTMANHFRPDCTSWHVVSYNDDGTCEHKQTFQGKNDNSAWARGQAWGIYGYTECYRETGDVAYLAFAQKIADMIMSRVKTEDLIPYWDYDAPEDEDTPRDASAAAVTACGMFELSTFAEDGQKYFGYAEKILKSLSSPAYLAKAGENEGFIMMHSTGSLPHGSEIDTALNYADYYYLEAIRKYMELKGLEYSDL